MGGHVAALQPYAWGGAVFLNEDDAGRFEGGADGGKLGSPRYTADRPCQATVSFVGTDGAA